MINIALNKTYQTSIQLVDVLINQTFYLGCTHAFNLLISRFTLLSPLQNLTPLGRSRLITVSGNGPMTSLRSRVDQIFHAFRLNTPQFGPYALLMAATFGSNLIQSIVSVSFTFLEKPQAPISCADAKKALDAFEELPTPKTLSPLLSASAERSDVESDVD